MFSPSEYRFGGRRYAKFSLRLAPEPSLKRQFLACFGKLRTKIQNAPIGRVGGHNRGEVLSGFCLLATLALFAAQSHGGANALAHEIH